MKNDNNATGTDWYEQNIYEPAIEICGMKLGVRSIEVAERTNQSMNLFLFFLESACVFHLFFLCWRGWYVLFLRRENWARQMEKR